MKKVQRFKYGMLVRIRDFGSEHAGVLPEGSVGGSAMARRRAPGLPATHG